VLTDQPTGDLTTPEREGLAWLDRLTSGRATDEDLAATQAWYAESAANADAFDGAVRLRRLMQMHMQAAPEIAPVVAARGPSLARRGFLAAAVTAPAAMAAWCAVQPPFGLWPSLAELRADYRTGKGARRTIEVAGARIELNTQTAVALRSDGVRLISGEIVAETGRGRTVAIEAGAGMVRASEGHLDVRDDDGAVCVTCIAGKATVAHGPTGTERTLQGGQLVRYDTSAIGDAAAADIVRTTAWRQGVLIFRDEQLTSVVSELNRYRAGRIVLTNSQAGGRRFNGTFRTDRLEDAVAQMVSVAGLSRTDLPAGVTLLS
jgi:transmembrane sensor